MNWHARVRNIVEPWSEGEPCVCGHRWSDHADRTEYGQALPNEGRCSVCACDRFNWDVDAGATRGDGGTER